MKFEIGLRSRVFYSLLLCGITYLTALNPYFVSWIYETSRFLSATTLRLKHCFPSNLWCLVWGQLCVVQCVGKFHFWCSFCIVVGTYMGWLQKISSVQWHCWNGVWEWPNSWKTRSTYSNVFMEKWRQLSLFLLFTTSHSWQLFSWED